MANNKKAVRRILDQVKAEGRTSLTAPEGKLVCDAYGIPVPKEGVATSAAEAAKLASAMGFPVVLKIVSPEILHKTEAGGVLVGVKTAAEVRKGFDTIMRQREEVRPQGHAPRRAGAADARGRSGSHRRRGHRSVVRQARRVRPGRRAGRSAEGRHVPARAGVEGRRAVDARRHRRRADPEGRARRRRGRPRGARADHPERLAARRRLPRNLRDGSEPGVRDAEGRDRRRRAHRLRLESGAARATGRARRTSSAR